MNAEQNNHEDYMHRLLKDRYRDCVGNMTNGSSNVSHLRRRANPYQFVVHYDINLRRYQTLPMTRFIKWLTEKEYATIEPSSLSCRIRLTKEGIEAGRLLHKMDLL